MAKPLYPLLSGDDIQHPVMSPQIFHHQCCDCGLVHDVEIDLVEPAEGQVMWRWRRNNRRTGQVRRHRKGVAQLP